MLARCQDQCDVLGERLKSNDQRLGSVVVIERKRSKVVVVKRFGGKR